MSVVPSGKYVTTVHYTNGTVKSFLNLDPRSVDFMVNVGAQIDVIDSNFFDGVIDVTLPDIVLSGTSTGIFPVSGETRDSTSGGFDPEPETTPTPTPTPTQTPTSTPIPFPQIDLKFLVAQYFTSSRGKEVFVQVEVNNKDPIINNAVLVLQIRSEDGTPLAVERSDIFPEGTLGFKDLQLGGISKSAYSWSIPDLVALNPINTTAVINLDVVCWKSLDNPVPYAKEITTRLAINETGRIPPKTPPPTQTNTGGSLFGKILGLWIGGVALSALSDTTKNPFKGNKRK